MDINKLSQFLPAALLALGLSTTAHATLIDRGNGMIYDSDQNLTWLQDANYAKTSGYDSDGKMTWNDAMAWADTLNYAGFNDWRLPTVIDKGNNGCDYSFSGGTDCGFNVDTSGSELAYLWYDILGNKGYYDTNGNAPQDGWGPNSKGADGVEFVNMEYSYFTGTEYATNKGLAWVFNPVTGLQSNAGKGGEIFAWAVRPGDVAAATDVPEPGSLLLLLAGIGGAIRSRRQP